jgi:hypothetical protein
MNNAIHVQYVGFQARPKVREYTFLVKDGEADAREFKLTIANEAFLSQRARYQDAPDICAHRLQRELDASDNHPAHTHCTISDAELEEYRLAHNPKAKPSSLYKMYKPNRDPF